MELHLVLQEVLWVDLVAAVEMGVLMDLEALVVAVQPLEVVQQQIEAVELVVHITHILHKLQLVV